MCFRILGLRVRRSIYAGCRIMLFLILSLSFPLLTHAQQAWEWQNPLPQGYDLNCVSFGDSTDGWAAGDGGSIIHTSDGGNTWSLQTSNTPNALHGICFVNNYVGTAVGDSGIILHTEDGGITWEPQQSGVMNTLFAVTFVSEYAGWTVGADGIILKTTDRGFSWQQQVGNIKHDFHAASFLDAHSGYLAGNSGTILRTTNGGLSWDSLNVGTNYNLLGIATLNSNTVIAIGGSVEVAVEEYGPHGQTYTVYYYYNMIYRTTNNGASWKADSLSAVSWPEGEDGFKSIQFVTPSIGWIVSYGEVYSTTDSGATWKGNSISSGEPGEIFFNSLNSGFVVGEAGEVFHSTNEGQSWSEVAKNAAGGFGIPYYNLFFVNSNVGWCFGSSGGNGGIMHTIDGGTNWNVQWNDQTPWDGWDLTSGFFVDENNGWVIGDYYNTQYGQQQGIILHTSNAGKSWGNQIPALTGIVQPSNIFFINPNVGWLTDGWDLFHTTNAGNSWSLISQEIVKPFNHICFLDSNIGWTVSADSGKIFRTSDAGVTWIVQHKWDTGVSRSLNGIYFKDSSNGWIAGWNSQSGAPSQGISLHTSNGGQTWETLISQSTNFGFAQFSFVDSNQWWATNANNTLYRTINSGQTWETQSFGMPLYSACFTDTVHGWVCGGGAAILHTSTGGITNGINIPENVSKIALLDYPNPSNGRGTIFKFDLPTSSFVSLRIMNILGVQITTLLSTNLNQGSYQVEWDEQDALPGTYFCELTAGNQKQSIPLVISK